MLADEMILQLISKTGKINSVIPVMMKGLYVDLKIKLRKNKYGSYYIDLIPNEEWISHMTTIRKKKEKK